MLIIDNMDNYPMILKKTYLPIHKAVVKAMVILTNKEDLTNNLPKKIILKAITHFQSGSMPLF